MQWSAFPSQVYVCCVCEACVCAFRVSEFAGLAHLSTQRQLCPVFGCVVVWGDADMWCPGKHIRTRQFRLIPALLSFDGPFIFKCCQNGEPNTSIRILKVILEDPITQQTLPMKYIYQICTTLYSVVKASWEPQGPEERPCLPNRRSARSIEDVSLTCELSTSTATVVCFHD